MMQNLLFVAALFLVLWIILFLVNTILAKYRKPYDLVEEINHLLPQTQCGYCGYAGCKPYAEAIAKGEMFNRCPPGDQETVDAIALLLDVPSQVLDSDARPAEVAFIREEECIGCTKCIQACPVDAILGAAKFMHTVIADECTGCDLCVEVCPVDCIDMLLLEPAYDKAAEAKQRFENRLERKEQVAQVREQARLQRQASLAEKALTIDPVAQALARAKDKVHKENSVPFEQEEILSEQELLRQRIEKLREKIALKEAGRTHDIMQQTLAKLEQELHALEASC